MGWRGALGLVVSAVLLWLAFRSVDWQRVVEALRNANVALMLLSAGAATCIFPLRAWRWRVILDPVAADIRFGKLWRATAIGMMVNNVVPARAGEIARAYALSREEPRVPFAASFASLAVDRVFDAVIILLLMFGALLDPRFPSGALTSARGTVVGAIVGLVAVIAVLYLIVFFPERMITLYELFARRVAPRFEARGKELLHAFASGLSVLRSPSRFLSVVWWTLLHWLVNALAFWIAFRGMNIDAPFSAALFIQGIIAIGVAVPAAPGFFGVWELAATLGLGLFRVPAPLAVAWAISFHILSYIPITLIGAWYFLRMGLHLGDLQQVDRGAVNEAPAGP